MARYTVSYKCGHEGTVNLLGPQRYRENRLAYIEEGECFECYKQRSTEVAREQAEEMELPPLVNGSEAQLRWAETIRIKKLNEIENETERLKESKDYRLILLAVEQISNEISAKKWIEWRDDTPRYIIATTLRAMKNAPTEEQKKAEQEAREKAEAVQRAALVEATIRPTSPVCEMVAEISVDNATISVFFPERHEAFRKIVRYLGYDWISMRWQRSIGKFAGSVDDRVVELGHTLLASGFLVRIFDDALRARIVDDTFEPEQTRWITRMAKGDYAGWLVVNWGRHEDYYDVSRRINGSKYSRPHVVVPPAEFAQILDFAQRYGFRLSDGAQEAVRLAKADREKMLVVSKEPIARRERKTAVSTMPPVLVIPEAVAIADELRDD